MKKILKKVDFLIIGAMKCATTSLYTYLRSHPDIYMSEYDETGYFLEQNNDRNIKGFTNNEIRRYQNNDQLFRRISQRYAGERYFGEYSTDYSKFPYRRLDKGHMVSMNPEMKFIYIIRNPLDRIVSNYFHFRQYRGAETDPDFSRELLTHAIYMNVSCYFYQLGHYLDVYPKSSFKIILFEDFISNRDKTLCEICDFLEISSSFVFPELGKHNVSSLKQVIATPKFSGKAYTRMMKKISPDMDALGKFMGNELFEIWDVSRKRWVA